MDIQLLWDEDVNEDELIALCQRTFTYRQAHDWPPSPMAVVEDLRPIYDDAVSQTMDEAGTSSVNVEYAAAVDWFNAKMSDLGGAPVVS